MKPKQTPATTPTLPMRFATAMPVASVSFAVALPRTISRRRMMFAGEKKCVPITSCGRFVAAAIWSTSSVEVLEASTAPGLATASSLAKISFFSDSFSNTASTMKSA